MKITRRSLIFTFFFLAILLLALLNWPVVMGQVIEPLALALWLLLRIFILSIDQIYYWWILIIAFAVLFIRLIPHSFPEKNELSVNRLNETINSIERWRSLYLQNESNFYDNFREREYIRMLLSHYASKLHQTTDYKLYEELKTGEVPIPEDIRRYLFPPEPVREKRGVIRIWNALKTMPRDWFGITSKQKKLEMDQMTERILTFFESSLEMTNDN